VDSVCYGPALLSVSPAANWDNLQTGKRLIAFVVAVLGVGEGQAAVDFQGLSAGVAAVGLDEGVVDALGLQPGEQEVPQPVPGHVVRQAGCGGVAGEQRADAAGEVGLLPRAWAAPRFPDRLIGGFYAAVCRFTYPL
jgi:hypothetical protein